MSPPTVAPARKPRWETGVFWLCWTISLLFLTVFYRMRRYHADRLPPSGACLVVANHQSHLDPPLVGLLSTRRPMHFVARIGLFKFKPFGRLITALNSVPIRDNESDVAAIREVLARLAQGHAVLVFPEGSRSPDGAMHEFKGGVALVLKRARCPVVPVAVEGCFDAFPRHRRFPRLLGQRVAVMAGTPIAPDDLLKDGPAAALERLRQEIDAMRRDLRARLRAASNGRVPGRVPVGVPVGGPGGD
ncbi:MAG TPA: hypothetical protein DEB06_01925, partial [Phycisphaerales bacterium]|nr:hypothetical protein [Phycisphaerales bacterium]